MKPHKGNPRDVSYLGRLLRPYVAQVITAIDPSQGQQSQPTCLRVLATNDSMTAPRSSLSRCTWGVV